MPGLHPPKGAGRGAEAPAAVGPFPKSETEGDGSSVITLGRSGLHLLSVQPGSSSTQSVGQVGKAPAPAHALSTEELRTREVGATSTSHQNHEPRPQEEGGQILGLGPNRVGRLSFYHTLVRQSPRTRALGSPACPLLSQEPAGVPAVKYTT